MAPRLAGGALLQPAERTAAPGGARRRRPGAARASFDSVHGGWGGAPKFPAASVIELLLARGETTMALFTLRSMASGGIFDQVGGGFPATAVDATWTVPHFEKMLYDNALLARAYLHALAGLAATPCCGARCEETLDWALREMAAEDGGFCSALDADSEGVEGQVLRLDARRAARGRSATDAPRRSPGSARPRRATSRAPNVLESRGPEPDAASRERIRATLLAARAGARAPRARRQAADELERADDRGAGRRRRGARARRLRRRGRATRRVPARRDLRDAGRPAAADLQRAARRSSPPTSRTTPSCSRRCSSSTRPPSSERWFAEARALADATPRALRRRRARRLLLDRRRRRAARRPPQGPRGRADPGGRLGRRARACCAWPRSPARARYEERAVGQLRLLAELAPRHPTAFGHLLRALDLHLRPAREVAVVGPEDARAPLVAVVPRALRPRSVLAGGRARARARAAAGGPRAGRRAGRPPTCAALRLPAPGDRPRPSARRARRRGGRLGRPVWRHRRRSVSVGTVARLLSVPAGRRAKWVILALWLVVLFGASAANLPGKFSDAEKQRVDLVPPRRRRVDQGAGQVQDDHGRRERRRARRLPPRRRADAPPTRRASGPTSPAWTRFEARYPQLVRQRDGRVFRLASISPDRTTALVAGDIRTNGRGQHDPRPGRRHPRRSSAIPGAGCR